MPLRLEKTRPLDPAALTASDRALWARFPNDFRRFYVKQNGGHCQQQFRIRMTSTFTGKPRTMQHNTLVEMWRFDRRKLKAPPSILREHFGRHLAEGFLPRGVFVIGHTLQNCLVAISIAEHDIGNIYYWEWYWRYPWYKGFFTKRIREAVRRFKARRVDLYGRRFPTDYTLEDAANHGTLVRIGDSFSGFLRSLKEQSDDD